MDEEEDRQGRMDVISCVISIRFREPEPLLLQDLTDTIDELEGIDDLIEREAEAEVEVEHEGHLLYIIAEIPRE